MHTYGIKRYTNNKMCNYVKKKNQTNYVYQ